MQLISTAFLAILAGLATAPFYSIPPALVWLGAGSLLLLWLLLNQAPRTGHLVFALLFFCLPILIIRIRSSHPGLLSPLIS